MVVRDMLVELGVLFRRDIRLVTCPQSASLIDGFLIRLSKPFPFLFIPFFLHQDWQ